MFDCPSRRVQNPPAQINPLSRSTQNGQLDPPRNANGNHPQFGAPTGTPQPRQRGPSHYDSHFPNGQASQPQAARHDARHPTPQHQSSRPNGETWKHPISPNNSKEMNGTVPINDRLKSMAGSTSNQGMHQPNNSTSGSYAGPRDPPFFVNQQKKADTGFRSASNQGTQQHYPPPRGHTGQPQRGGFLSRQRKQQSYYSVPVKNRFDKLPH